MTNYTDNIGNRERKCRGLSNGKLYDLDAVNYDLLTGLSECGMVNKQWCKFERIIDFTGLKDKNGKEIYEGDIVLAKLTGYAEQWLKAVVEYENGCYGVRFLEGAVLISTEGKFKSFEGCDTTERIEVIGNLFETPDLLPQPTNE